MERRASELSEIDEHAVTEFTTGACGYLAAVLHDLTGWQIVAEFEDAPFDDDVRHVWVLNDEGLAVDINGVHRTAWAPTRFSGELPGRIASLSRDEAVGRGDTSYLEWAAELVASFPDRFGVAGPSSSHRERTGP